LKLSQIWQTKAVSSETPERLKASTEDLLFSKGEAATTLRDITEMAGANVAAVAYHFKSKNNLVALVFAEAIDEVTSIQLKRVQALAKNHSLRELIEVWLHPLLGVNTPDDREAKLWRIIQRGAAEKSPGLIANMTRSENAVEMTLLPLLEAHLPHLTREEVFFRHNAIIGGLSGLVNSPIAIDFSGSSNNSKSREFMIAWIEGSLRGPSSSI
jgi:AcrR family transcriptional regulator